MKKIKILVASLLIGSVAYAQQPPQGTPGGGINWKRGGNSGPIGSPNIFGTSAGNNNPIYTYTNGINRTRLNGTLTTLINGVNQNVDGNFGIGRNGYFANNTPRTLFHLQGPDNSNFGAGGGWRSWMSTGMYVSENSDAMYVGMKPVPGSVNRSNAIINWSDDPWAGATSGVDKLSFVFTQTNGGNGTGTNPINAASLGGYEFMMMAPSTSVYNSQGTGEGTIGVGPVFTDAAPPRSRLHINAEESLFNWLQLTNQTGTGQTASDGLRMGINGDNNTNVNGNALIYNQENRHILFSTNNNTNFVNIANGTTLERMRITAIAAPTSLAGGGYGVNNPAGLINGNLTRVAISHDPANPVTRPLSLLHLGYNTGANSSTPTATDGWRNWMDLGMFVSNGTDNTYIGLKEEAGIFGDRQDAVLNWGDNDASNPLFGPDNLRFIFTSTTTGAGNSPANSNNGLETMRIIPDTASTMGGNFGMVGIGDWTTAFNVANPIDAKLDIDGDLRIRTVTKDTTLLQVLVIDSNDHNRVHWRSIDDLGGNVTANNGLSVDPLNANNIQLGQEVIGGALSFNGPAELLNDREIPLNGHDLIFSSTNNGFTTPGIERISIGLNPFTPGTPVFPTNPQNYVSSASAKLNLINTTEETGAHFLTFMDPANVGFAPPQYSGVKGTVYGLHNDKSIIGVIGQGVSALTGVVVEGVRGEAFGNGFNIGVKGMSFTANKTSYGGFFRSHSATSVPCLNGDNYGVYAEATGSSVSNIAIYATIDPTNPCNAPDNWAGWFNGNVNVLGNVTQTSDARLKNNINSIGLTEAREIINQLNPVTFNYDNSANTRLALPSGLKYGLIAQEVENVLPEIVYENTLPAERDSMGNVISSPFTYKTLDYKDFVPILIAGMKEQQQVISDLQSTVEDLKNCLNNANICTEGNKTINQGLNNEVNQRSIELTNHSSIILDQNLPNPFAENTVINYNIPTDVVEAKLMFYDLNGRIIKELIIEERGESKLTVYGTNLKTGVYTYSLIADGELIATKKMVKK